MFLASRGIAPGKQTKAPLGVIISLRGRRPGKAILKIYLFRFLWKEASLSQDFNVVGSTFQMMGAATEKKHACPVSV